MAESHVLAGSVTSPLYKRFHWDLTEITRYKEEKCFIYDGKRIKWSDSFEMLKLFVKCAIGQSGNWLSSGGKYKKFTSCNTDLILTWNYELGLLSLKGNTGVNLENLLINVCTKTEVSPTVSVDCSTLADLEGFIDKSYQNLLPQNDNDNTSSAQSIGSSTPFKMHTTDSLTSMQDQFKTFKEKIESTVTLLVNKISQQSQIIDQNKQEICKLRNDNLHLKSRVADLELKIFPKKDESIILINSSENTNITHNLLENTSQPVVSTELSKLKDGCRPTSHNIESKAAPSKSFSARPSEPKATPPKSSSTRPSEPSRNKKIFEKSSGKRNKAMIPCPFLKRRAYCPKGNECDFLHENAYQQNPLKQPLPSNLSQPNASQVPFPFDLNYYHYFPPPRNPVVHPPFPTFQYPHLPPLMSIPLAPLRPWQSRNIWT